MIFSIIETLQEIDQNKKRFLIIMDNHRYVLGTLTDGDVRRTFIRGVYVDDLIATVYTKTFRYLTLKDGIPGATEFFKHESIKFLPILDDEKRLVNIITKSQMHALLIQDIHAELDYNFLSLDEGIVDYQIFQRPWGFYKTAVMNNNFQSKVTSVNPKSQLSLQFHNHREEHWIVSQGMETVQLDQSVIEIKYGDSIFMPKECKHRLTNIYDEESLIITEVQIGDYFGEDGIIRMSIFMGKYRL